MYVRLRQVGPVFSSCQLSLKSYRLTKLLLHKQMQRCTAAFLAEPHISLQPTCLRVEDDTIVQVGVKSEY